MNTTKPETAELLMRSRYSAFCVANHQYLVDTLHPEHVTSSTLNELDNLDRNCVWLSLAILETEGGGNADGSGTVTFLAEYLQGGQIFTLHEKSRFVRKGEKWFYLDGDFLPTNKPVTVGRNSACPCGSGKKFKRCHA